ncbi:hypothetical protein HSBAA_33630 [Vreelandella sulfidaeris]|uniref:Uncharacterized protein n=1 Tax=Vreelandella sulfidaeris TaxID=115553 RepID=A0A455U940_9GAMM|nr:hypothetical protein HSBAA_33630 [Halomonas sulfidaeris]
MINLSPSPVDDIASQLGNGQANSSDAELEAKADRFIEDILAEGEDVSRGRQRRAVDEMGLELQQQAAHRSAMLQTPLRQLAHQSDEGGPVAKALTDLRGRMEGLDPLVTAWHRMPWTAF